MEVFPASMLHQCCVLWRGPRQRSTSQNHDQHPILPLLTAAHTGYNVKIDRWPTPLAEEPPQLNSLPPILPFLEEYGRQGANRPDAMVGALSLLHVQKKLAGSLEGLYKLLTFLHASYTVCCNLHLKQCVLAALGTHEPDQNGKHRQHAA